MVLASAPSSTCSKRSSYYLCDEGYLEESSLQLYVHPYVRALFYILYVRALVRMHYLTGVHTFHVEAYA